MATGVLRSFSLQPPAPLYFPMILQPSPSKDEVGETLKEVGDETDDKEDEGEEEDDEEDSGSEEEEECLELVGLHPANHTAPLDVAKQLLRFADVISRDVQRYFGRCARDQDACDIYNDTVSVATSGRLRYYDDLLKIARTGNLEEPETASLNFSANGADAGSNGLGPLAELFHQRGHSHGRGRPMSKRLLPLSFWTEPMACCSPFTLCKIPDSPRTDNETLSHASVHATSTTHVHYNAHVSTNVLENAHPDFSDLLANWDPHPEFPPTLTENTHI